MIWYNIGYFKMLRQIEILRLMIKYRKTGQKIYHKDIIITILILKQHLFLDQWYILNFWKPIYLYKLYWFIFLLVISWLRDLQITSCTWSSHVGLIMTQPAYDLLTSSFYPKILHASTLSSLPPLWALLCIVSSLLQSHLLCTNSATKQH